MRGQKRVEDARERAYDPRIHLLCPKRPLRRWMDRRVKPGNDDLKFEATTEYDFSLSTTKGQC
jgi:hypothetical protein